MTQTIKTRKSTGTTEKNTTVTGTAGQSALSSGCRQKKKSGKKPGETTIIVHTEDCTGKLEGIEIHPRHSGVVHRAMHRLEERGFLPARIIISKTPIDIVALRPDMNLLVQVITSRQEIPDARTLVSRNREKIGCFCRMKTSAGFRKILMAYSALAGWKVYDAFPGGLMPAWDFLKTSGKKAQ